MENLDAEHASETQLQQSEQSQWLRIRWRQWSTWASGVLSTRRSDWQRWITRVTGATAMRRAGWRRWIVPVAGAVIGILLLGGLLNGIATSIAYSNEQRDKAALDRALSVARTQYNVPPSRLQPIVDAEQRTVVATGGSLSDYQQTDSKLARLMRQVNALVRSTPAQAHAMTQSDLTALSVGVDTLVKGKFLEAVGFQQRLQQAQTRFAAATTTPQYFAVDTFTLDQLAAANAFQPTYQHLQDFTKLTQNESLLLGGATGPQTNDLQCAQGLTESFWLDDPLVQVPLPNANANTAVTPESQWPTSDLALFRAAATASDFTSLNILMAAQTQQTLANEAALLPGVATNLLQQFQSDIAQLKQENQDTTAFEQTYTQDQQQARKVATSPSLANYIAFVTTLRTHSAQIALPLIKAKANSDLATLRQLVAQGQALKTVDPANGVGYPDAYEYADPGTGIGDATQRLASAQTENDYQLVDNEILMFTANIQAMLTNLKDPTPWNQPHATDLKLINHYGIGSTRVLVVSLREQAMRLYDNGKFVEAIQVTTGAPDLPSVPGLHCALNHAEGVVFTSPDPPGSPNYYKPTPVHFSMNYSYYGYAVHDAWWRSWFGKYSNLPHFDPAAFNGGSHGCINMNYSNGDSAYVFSFAQSGTPIVVY